MQHELIVCTAGHVDHGKTTLINALTGIDCDTHIEEKRRGITINLGYAYIKLDHETFVAFVDVPGHHNFINTMVAGASGVHCAMLVVAADDGVMAQTIEHLKIMELLGIKKGLIVITKTDLVTEDMLSLCVDDVREQVKNSFLRDGLIFKVSARDKESIIDLKNYFYTLNYQKKRDYPGENFRMYIDRAFTLKGFGTIVTGSVLGGRICKGDQIYFSQIEKKSKIKQIQRHGLAVPEIGSGERAALNLDIDRQILKPGILITDKPHALSLLIDVELLLLEDKKNNNLKIGSKVVFLSGTFRTEARLNLLSDKRGRSGQKIFAQLLLTEGLVPFRKDRFIIRSTSADKTIGGGIIMDPYPFKHARKTEKLLYHLNKISTDTDEDFITAKVVQSPTPLSLHYFAQVLQKTQEDLLKLINNKLHNIIFQWGPKNSICLFCEKHKKSVESELYKLLEKIFSHNYEAEIPMHDIITYFDRKEIIYNEIILAEFLANFVQQKKIIKTSNGYKLLHQQEAQINLAVKKLYQIFEQNKINFLNINDCADHLSFEKKVINLAVNLLIKEKYLYQVGDFYMLSNFVDSNRVRLTKFLNLTGEGITVSEFRDLLNCNRQISLLLFSLFENEGLIYRQGDLRFLVKK